jgi:hypothetical protein
LCLSFTEPLPLPILGPDVTQYGWKVVDVVGCCLEQFRLQTNNFKKTKACI